MVWTSKNKRITLNLDDIKSIEYYKFEYILGGINYSRYYPKLIIEINNIRIELSGEEATNLNTLLIKNLYK